MATIRDKMGHLVLLSGQVPCRFNQFSMHAWGQWRQHGAMESTWLTKQRLLIMPLYSPGQ
jgi:hypothetical protein